MHKDDPHRLDRDRRTRPDDAGDGRSGERPKDVEPPAKRRGSVTVLPVQPRRAAPARPDPGPPDDDPGPSAA